MIAALLAALLAGQSIRVCNTRNLPAALEAYGQFLEQDDIHDIYTVYPESSLYEFCKCDQPNSKFKDDLSCSNLSR